MPRRLNLPMSYGSAYGENVGYYSPTCQFLLTIFAVPELRIYRVWDKPIGPHPLAMFEVNIFSPGMLAPYWMPYLTDTP